MSGYIRMSMIIPSSSVAELTAAERRKYDEAVKRLTAALDAAACGGENQSGVDVTGYRFACVGECSNSTASEAEDAACAVAMAANATVYLSMEHDGDMDKWIGPEAEDRAHDDMANRIMALFNALPIKRKREVLERLSRRMPASFKTVAIGIKS